MNDIAKAIAYAFCCEECRRCDDCSDNKKCWRLADANALYTAHVKPLEEALEKAQAQNAAVLTEQAAKLLQGVATGITGDAESFRIRMCITCPHCGLVMDSVEEATAHDAACEKHPAVIRAVKAEADKATLVEALEEMVSVAEIIAGFATMPENADGPLIKARAALAKVKEASCPKN